MIHARKDRRSRCRVTCVRSPSPSMEGRAIGMKGRLAALAAALGVFALVAAPLAGAKKPPPGSAPGNSGAAHQCQKGGYLSLVGADGTTFRNVGACVSFAARGGRFATGLVIPAGRTATLSSAQFGDALLPTAPLAPNTATKFPGIRSPTAPSWTSARTSRSRRRHRLPGRGGGGHRAVPDRGAPADLADRLSRSRVHVLLGRKPCDHDGFGPRLVSIRDSVFSSITAGALVPLRAR